MNSKTMGEFLKELRNSHGMTQQQVADRLNVSNKSVSRWERDETTPDISFLPAISEIYGITCDELLGGQKNLTLHNNTIETKTDKQLEKFENNFSFFAFLSFFIIFAVILYSLSF